MGVIGACFGRADPTGFGPGAHYSFLVMYGFITGRWETLSAGDTLTFLDVPGPATGSAPDLPFTVSTAPTADDPGHTDVTFTYNGPTLGGPNPTPTPCVTFRAGVGGATYNFNLDTAAPIGPTVRFRSRVGLTPDQPDHLAIFSVAVLPS